MSEIELEYIIVYTFGGNKNDKHSQYERIAT